MYNFGGPLGPLLAEDVQSLGRELPHGDIRKIDPPTIPDHIRDAA